MHSKANWKEYEQEWIKSYFHARQFQKFDFWQTDSEVFLPRDEFNKKMKKNDEEYDEEGDEEEEEDEEEDGRRWRRMIKKMVKKKTKKNA